MTLAHQYKRMMFYIKNNHIPDFYNVVLDLHYRYYIKIKKLGDVETDVQIGRNRITYLFSNHVVKIPVDDNGVADNDWEGSLSNGESLNDPNEVQYARTRLIYVKDIPIVLMQRVKPAFELNLPDWVNSVDCGQVGYTKAGRLVAFDYGIR